MAGDVKVVMLGIKEIIERSTAVHLCTIVKKTLEEYEIPLRSIYAVTTDNAANMIATSQELENELKKSIMEDELAENSDIDERPPNDDNSHAIDVDDALDIDDEIRNFLNERDTSDEDILSSIFDDNLLSESLLRSVGDNLNREINPDNSIHGVRCAIHTLQLAIKDAIASMRSADSNVILLCRNIAKFMRLKSTQIEMRNKNISIVLPTLDVETRWNSTYALVSVVIIFPEMVTIQLVQS